MMLVNSRAARKCCNDCDSDYGHSNNTKGKTKLRRTLRRREKQSFKRNPE